MKNENITASEFILIFSGKNAFWNQRKSLKNDKAKVFVSWQSLITFADQIFILKRAMRKRFAKS